MDNNNNARRPLQDASNRPSASNSSLTPQGINALDYRHLQKKCKAVGLSAGGSTEVLRQRLLDWSSGHKTTGNKRAFNDGTTGKREETQSNDDQPSPKRPKKDVAADLICPITLQLPSDPVMAEDGRIYERSAIEEYFCGCGSGKVKSPLAGCMIGRRLIPAFQQRSMIETSIENGNVHEDLARDWNERVKQKKEMKDLLEKAEGGAVDAMEAVAINYKSGLNGFKKDFKMAEEWKKRAKQKKLTKEMEDLLKKAEGGNVAAMVKVANGYNWAVHGFKQDYKMAYQWYEKARVSGNAVGMTKVGEFLICGFGVTKNAKKGMMYLGMAAGRGSDRAAYILGKCLADGLHDFPVDKAEARRLLEKCLSGNCPHKHMNDLSKHHAQHVLDQLVNEEQD